MDPFNTLTDARHGRMLVHTHDMYVAKSFLTYGEFSEGEVAVFREYVKPGAIALDIGANIGAHTVPLARLVGDEGMVVAYEPQRLTYQALCANVALNSLHHVHTVYAAVGRAPGAIRVPMLDVWRENNIGAMALGAHETGEPVPVVTVDAMGLARCDFMKIDVEGMECDVLTGARATVARCRPTLYVENDRPEHSDELLWLLRVMGYRLYWHCPPLYSPENWRKDPENIFVNDVGQIIVSTNVLAIPEERGTAPEFADLRAVE